MQYIRRRILRVSGVTVRDEHLERRDFPSAPLREEWSEIGERGSEGAALERTSVFAKNNGDHRERT